MKPLNARQSIILAAVKAAAEKGAPCPSNGELASLVNFDNVGSPYKILDQLEHKGLIQIVRGTNWRIITITETGQSTYRSPSAEGKDQYRPRLRVVERTDSAKAPVPTSAPVFRDPCPCCGVRLDADPAMCCPRGRAIRKLVA